MHVFYTIKLCVLLRDKLQSHHVILIAPAKNYHVSNVFHSLYTQTLQLIRDHIEWVQLLPAPVLPQDYFCYDSIHFSKHGELDMFRFLTDFVKNIGDQFEVNPNIVAPQISSPRAISDQARERLDGRRRPINLRHEHAHYLPRTIKKVAVSISRKNLCQTGIDIQKSHFVSVITDSLYRIAISPHPISDVNHASDNLLPYPYAVSISPGCSARTICTDFTELTELNDISTVVNVILLGTNEILQYQTLIEDYLCKQNLRLCARCAHSTRRPYEHKTEYSLIALQRFRQLHSNALLLSHLM